MEKIPLPTTVKITSGTEPHSAQVVVEPCFPGYGTTIGNSIRRHLLSSLPGAAVTGFKVKGVQHEFSAIPEIEEDVIEISLHLKKLRLKVFSDAPVKLELHASGEKKVTAADIEKNSDVEIMNKDLVIATLTDKKANLDMEIYVSRGRGYLPTEAREKEEIEPGVIIIDSNFSPIEKVGFKTENVRVGHMTNWERLILNIKSDGTLHPKEAVHIAVKDLLEHFKYIEENTVLTDAEKIADENAPKEETKKKKKSKKSEEKE